MTIVSFKLAILKFWAWLKKNWKFVAGIIVTLAVFSLTRRGPSLKHLISKINDDYDKEIDVLNESHKKEIQAHEELKERYDSIMSQIVEEYDKKSDKLEKEKDKKIKKILRDHSDDPDEITRQLSELTGFSIHVS